MHGLGWARSYVQVRARYSAESAEGGETKSKKITSGLLYCNRACGCCNLVRRIFPSWRQVPPSDKDKARIKGNMEGERSPESTDRQGDENVEKGKKDSAGCAWINIPSRTWHPQRLHGPA